MLDRIYGVLRTAGLQFNKILNIRQGSCSVSVYFDKFMHLITVLGVTDVSHQIQFFIHGLNEHIKGVLEVQNFSKLMDAVRLASAIETRKLNEAVSVAINRFEGGGDDQAQPAPPHNKCFICGDENHYMRFCPYNQGAPSTNSNWPAPPMPPQYGYNPWGAPSFPPWGQQYPNQNFQRPSYFRGRGRRGRGGAPSQDVRASNR